MVSQLMQHWSHTVVMHDYHMWAIPATPQYPMMSGGNLWQESLGLIMGKLHPFPSCTAFGILPRPPMPCMLCRLHPTRCCHGVFR